MKKVLVIYYTQTGQLSSAVKATLEPLQNDPEFEIHFEEIIPKVKYPYPWKYVEFFDIFPETVEIQNGTNQIQQYKKGNSWN